MKRLNIVFTCALLLPLVFSCNKKEWGSSDDKATESKQETSTQVEPPVRPTDENEGLPGYLTDPNLISLESKVNEVTISGSEKSIQGQVNGSLLNVVLHVMEMSYEGAWNSSDQTIDVTVIGSGSPALDGSFSITAKRKSSGSHIVLSTRPSSGGRLDVPVKEDRISAVIFPSGEIVGKHLVLDNLPKPPAEF